MANRIMYIIIAIVLINTGCKDWFKDDSFSLKKENYNGSEIRTDGYYYMFSKEHKVYPIILFYGNGIVHNRFTVVSLSLLENEMKTNANTFNNGFKDNWGLFVIDRTEIKVENIIAMGGLSRFAYTDYGEILNDTTIYFYKHKESYSNYSEVMDDTLHFKQFSPKPDSTNVFIK